MGPGLGQSVGYAVGLISRASEMLAVSAPDGVPLEQRAREILEFQSPRRVDAHLAELVHRVQGFGRLQPLLDDPDVTDVLVNGPREIWLDTPLGLRLSSVRFESQAEVVALVERLIAPLGLRIDRSAPMVDARLPDGSRLHAVLPPASVDVPLVAIRRFRSTIDSFNALVAAGSATREQTEQIGLLVDQRRTILVCGGTGTGKTTLLNLLSALIPEGDRTVVVEDASELSLAGHVVRLQAKPPNTEGAGEISIRSLMRSALRLRPDRIVLGEVRGGEALDLITALNTGHRGSMTTVHANSADEAMWRLETLAMAPGAGSPKAIRRQLYSAIDVVIQMERFGPERRIAEISERDASGWKS